MLSVHMQMHEHMCMCMSGSKLFLEVQTIHDKISTVLSQCTKNK